MGTDSPNEETRSTTKREMAGFSLVFVTLYYILELLYIGPKTNVIIVSGFVFATLGLGDGYCRAMPDGVWSTHRLDVDVVRIQRKKTGASSGRSNTVTHGQHPKPGTTFARACVCLPKQHQRFVVR